MYYYLYDSRLTGRKYNNIIARVETRLVHLGINGKINRLSFLKNIKQIISEEIRRGVKTIVVVGNDQTVGQVINLLADLNLTIGLIPIGPNNRIAKFLGIPPGEEACDILSSRIVKNLDLGKVNNYYFVTSLETGGRDITLECNDDYLINLQNSDNIINIGNLNNFGPNFTNPLDGQLDIFVQTNQRHFWGKNKSGLSRLLSRKLKISGKKTLPIFISDEKKIIKTPVEITVAPGKLKMIVGKQRYF